jgi:hypothetical protein
MLAMMITRRFERFRMTYASFSSLVTGPLEEIQMQRVDEMFMRIRFREGQMCISPRKTVLAVTFSVFKEIILSQNEHTRTPTVQFIEERAHSYRCNRSLAQQDFPKSGGDGIAAPDAASTVKGCGPSDGGWLMMVGEEPAIGIAAFILQYGSDPESTLGAKRRRERGPSRTAFFFGHDVIENLNGAHAQDAGNDGVPFPLGPMFGTLERAEGALRLRQDIRVSFGMLRLRFRYGIQAGGGTNVVSLLIQTSGSTGKRVPRR